MRFFTGSDSNEVELDIRAGDGSVEEGGSRGGKSRGREGGGEAGRRGTAGRFELPGEN